MREAGAVRVGAEAWEAMSEAERSAKVATYQGDCTPAFDERLVGKRLEVLWKYFDKTDGNKQVLIWASGRVVRIADGLTTTKSKKAKKVLPAGAVLWAWDAIRGRIWSINRQYGRVERSPQMRCCLW